MNTKPKCKELFTPRVEFEVEDAKVKIDFFIIAYSSSYRFKKYCWKS